MEKKVLVVLYLVIFLISIILVFAAYSSIPNPGHGADVVYIRLNGTDQTLQEAITNGKFVNCTTSTGSYSQAIIFGHKAEEVYVNVSGAVKNLQSAINDDSLGNSEKISGVSTFPPITYGETADKIIITNRTGAEKTLQQAIDDGEFKCDESVKVVLSASVLGDGNVPHSSTPENISDDNPNSFFFTCSYDFGGQTYSPSAQMLVLLNFSKSTTLKSLTYTFDHSACGGKEFILIEWGAGRQKVEILVGETWEQIHYEYLTGRYAWGYCNGAVSPIITTNLVNASGWNNVKAVRVVIQAYVVDYYGVCASKVRIYNMNITGTEGLINIDSYNPEVTSYTIPQIYMY